MSHPINDAILEASVDNFDIAIAERDFTRAERIVALLHDQGFVEAARKLGLELANKTLYA